MLTATAGAAGNGTDRPFRFSGAGVHTIGFDGLAARCAPGALFRTFVTTAGEATHIGRFDVRGDHCTYPTPAGPPTYADGRWTLTAANGDTFQAPYEPAARQPPNPAYPATIVTDTVHKIRGGTGRFSGATGSFTCRVILSNIDWSTFTTDLDASCAGTISY